MVASISFTAAAARWLPSGEKRVKDGVWSEFSKLVLELFGRNHHELLVRQLLGIKQPGSVSEYIEKFSELVGQLIAYDSHADHRTLPCILLTGGAKIFEHLFLFSDPPSWILLSLLRNCRRRCRHWSSVGSSASLMLQLPRSKIILVRGPYLHRQELTRRHSFNLKINSGFN